MNILTSRLPALKFIAMFGAAHLSFSLMSNVILDDIFPIVDKSKHTVNPIVHVERHTIEDLIYNGRHAESEVFVQHND